jgi:[acyl-carrier-protein] S-malonyltransferase
MKKVAFVFPGQGSQSVGMLDSFVGCSGVVDTIEAASDVMGQDFSQLIAHGDEKELNSTVNTQPVMLACGYALFKAWISRGGRPPEIMAGHSLGEYTAATVAGVFSFEDALKTVRFRAQVMQESVPAGVGGMSAVLGLDVDKVRDVCVGFSTKDRLVEAVNLNSPEQTVIAGHLQALDDVVPLLKSAGAKRVVSLPVSAPFHSSLMLPAAEKLSFFLGQLNMADAKLSFINNVDVSIETSVSAIRTALVRQAYSAVRWVETIKMFEKLGVTHVVECGPGKVLSGLIVKISSHFKVLPVGNLALLDSAMEEVL